MRAEGLPVTAQMAGRPIGVMMGIGTALNPFTVRPSYKAIESLPIEEQRERLRDPAGATEDPGRKAFGRRGRQARAVPPGGREKVGQVLRHGQSAGLRARSRRRASRRSRQREGRTPEEVAYDYILEDGQYLYFPVVNYVTGDHEPIREMLNDPACLLGLSDGGAHCTSIVDSGVPTFMLAHWSRDRQPRTEAAVEMLIKRQTSETADFFGLSIAAGWRRACAPTSI